MQSAIAFRLQKGDDLYQKLKLHMSAAIVTCVGSLQVCRIRLAGAQPDQQNFQVINGPLEIVSLVGTISPDGIHVHISVSDSTGHVWGGHLTEGSIVDTTAEIVLLDFSSLTQGKQKFARLPDPQTGFRELSIVTSS